MEFDLLSWGIGIPTGVGVNWLSYWLYRRFLRRRQARDAYVTVAHASGGVDFEGHVDKTSGSTMTYSCDDVDINISVKRDMGEVHIPAEEIFRKLLEALSNEPREEDKST